MNKKNQIIEVIPYNFAWAQDFKTEASLIRPLFSDNYVAIHHIGSTAVPGLSAKPTIDIILEVKNINLVDSYNDKLAKLGYEAWGEYGIYGRRFFPKGMNKRTHHVHVFQTGSAEIYSHIAFRDYLIAHPLEAEIYAKLKIYLAEKFFNNREAYYENKNNYVKILVEKALGWNRKFEKKDAKPI